MEPLMISGAVAIVIIGAFLFRLGGLIMRWGE
jgi:hypothetical protein